MKFVSMFMILCVAIAATAGIQKVFSVPELVDQYYSVQDSKTSKLKLMTKPMSSSIQRDCHERPDGKACSDLACQKLGAWGCDTMDEISAVNRACRGNYGSECLDMTCTKLGAWGCDTLDEVTDVARACVGNYNTDCFESVCQRLGAWGCDTLDEVTEVLRSCAGHD